MFPDPSPGLSDGNEEIVTGLDLAIIDHEVINGNSDLPRCDPTCAQKAYGYTKSLDGTYRPSSHHQLRCMPSLLTTPALCEFRELQVIPGGGIKRTPCLQCGDGAVDCRYGDAPMRLDRIFPPREMSAPLIFASDSAQRHRAKSKSTWLDPVPLSPNGFQFANDLYEPINLSPPIVESPFQEDEENGPQIVDDGQGGPVETAQGNDTPPLPVAATRNSLDASPFQRAIERASSLIAKPPALLPVVDNVEIPTAADGSSGVDQTLQRVVTAGVADAAAYRPAVEELVNTFGEINDSDGQLAFSKSYLSRDDTVAKLEEKIDQVGDDGRRATRDGGGQGCAGIVAGLGERSEGDEIALGTGGEDGLGSGWVSQVDFVVI
ncbi:hypothetical protein CI109_101651 [Kwoniella shandongensis]|uniref:Uncharacterized protein n=1 Tax=Kwoniella shandongensis TaxID=1734106 RepID=A0A5M6C6H7_9TREE|nr:uncharacterized protein CI109_001224 [Kwoniella shandongensis]KAA5530421.1 hypothetical protein CI109_001224 [Kwoniella shandongensis]